MTYGMSCVFDDEFDEKGQHDERYHTATTFELCDECGDAVALDELAKHNGANICHVCLEIDYLRGEAIRMARVVAGVKA